MAVEGIIANGVTQILKKLTSVVANEITLAWDFNDELKNLKSTLNMILAVMEDAEKKQVSEAAVRLWMSELKSMAYDAEDILDEYSYEVILCKRKKGDKSTVFNKVRNVFSSSKPSFVCSWNLAHKIKKINEKFNKIAKRKNDLGLQTINLGSSSSSDMNMMMMNRETYSVVVDDWKIVGRENDKSTIIKMLLTEENSHSSTSESCQSVVSVIPIVGMGGLGKTTMAQLVFNEEAVKRHFDIKVWICVSNPFDVKKLLRNIAKSLNENATYDDVATMENIVCGLQKDLRGKKLLLVLDDVWNKDHDAWYKFKTPLTVASKGSKILVTTRSVVVAKLMGDQFSPFELGLLNENDCWSLFKERAFGYVDGAKEIPNLVEIGKEMVRKCGGLPLAIIFLGNLMRFKKKEEEWKIIRDTKLWHESREENNRVLPSLRLSYDYLPSHLKQCFSYCSIFPKDHIISKTKLIRLWMAEGFFIESLGKIQCPWKKLVTNILRIFCGIPFFQNIEKNEEGDITCKMHDLVHDLARSAIENNECLIIENALDIESISEATRRLNVVYLDRNILPKLLETLKTAKNLRTIFVCDHKRFFGDDIGNIFNKNKRLRVLDLSGSGSVFSMLPDSIVELKHLRYLDYSGAIIPKGISRLSFLQTFPNLSLGYKKNNKYTCGGIGELENLDLLTGELTINGLKNVTSGRDAYRAKLEEKKHLRELYLSWEDGVFESDVDETVLEGLRPHRNLRKLGISYFEGAKLPRWMSDSSQCCVSNLVDITLTNCKFEQLTGLGELPFLRCLHLLYMHAVECIGNEFYGSSSATAATTTIAFPSLKRLVLFIMGSLQEWVVPPSPSTTTACFPLLEEIVILQCRFLTTITPTTTIFPSLKFLYLEQIDESAARQMVTNHLTSLTSLRLGNLDNLVYLPYQGLIENNNTLQSLEIRYCQKFEGFLLPNKDEDEDEDEEDQADDEEGEGGGGGVQLVQVSSSTLQSLTIYSCPIVRLVPDICSLTSLCDLYIEECKELKSITESVLTCLSSSLEHLQSVKILKTGDVENFEWEKES